MISSFYDMLNFNGILARRTSSAQVLKRRRPAHAWEAGVSPKFRRFLLSVCISVLAAPTSNAQTSQRDSVLTGYLRGIDGCDIPTKIRECDFILGSCDSTAFRETALKVFNHFRGSKLMGDENVAVHIADRWILGDGKTGLPDSTLAAIRSYAGFNRESLLGRKAPLLPEAGLDGFSDKKMTVLWFYDTDCSKCRLESILLEDFLMRHPECGLTAFYIGDETAKWEAFRKGHFTRLANHTDVRHLADPSGESGFRRKYSVTATPRMFLIDTKGIIVGRMLDTESLELLLDERTRREKEAVTELFYQLVPLRGEEAKNALEYLIDTRILCENSHFDTAEDSLMVVNFAGIQKELLSKARPGTKIAPVKVRASLNGRKPATYRLDRLSRARGRRHLRLPDATRRESREISGRTIIILHTAGCRQCEAELRAAKSLNINTLAVNIDEIQSHDPETFARLLDSFDLTALPLLIEIDRQGVILRRYFSLVQ